MSFRAQGMRTWLFQRLSAVYIAVYILTLLFWLLTHLPVSYTSWTALFSQPVILITTMLFYAAVFVHAWVGVRDILVDYVKPAGLRFTLLIALAFALLAMSLWVLIVVISLVKL